MGVGRFFCVALPLLLTIASIIALMVATLAGVSHTSLWVFTLDTKDLSISPADEILKGAASGELSKIGIHVRQNAVTDNITASKLGLADHYEVSLWGYCYSDSDGKNRHCPITKFDWASTALNTSYIENIGSAAGVKIDLPTEIDGALKTFRTITKWTEVAFIVALVALGIELITGIFANCSRAVSCLVYLVASVTALLVGVAAGLGTAMAVIVIGAVKSTAKVYGVNGSIGTSFLAAVWIATAFAIGAAFFWLFTICCCKPEHRRSSRGSGGKRFLDRDDGEKLLPANGSYRPISHDNYEMTGGNTGYHAGSNSGYYNPNQGQPSVHNGYSAPAPRYPGGGQTDLGYEPYAHRQ